MVDAIIDFDVNDRLSSVSAFADRLRAVTHCKPDQSFTIDLSSCGLLGPDGASILGAVILDARQQGIDVRVIPPAVSKDLQLFWNASGLSQLLETGMCPLSRSMPDSTVAPICQYRAASFNDADAILRLVRCHAEISEESEEYVRICVNEIIQNVQDHSESAIGCIMSAQFLPNRAIRVAIVDRGVGIHRSLRKRFPDTHSPALALKRVTQGHYSALSRVNNMGLGISNFCSIVDQLNGQATIISDAAAAERPVDGVWCIREHQNVFDGTGVFFTLRVGA